jgi:hypothetical protein
MPNPTSRIRIERRRVADLSDSQVEALIGFGRREAELLEQLEAATRAGDKDLAWQIAQALCRVEDRLQEMKK